MELTMVIPSYWGRERRVGWKEGDAVYDHPTPLDEDGTLARAIESMGILREKDFRLVVIAVATTPEIVPMVEEKVRGIIESVAPDTGIRASLFSHTHLSKIHALLRSEGLEGYTDLLQLRGYSNIRNLCVFIPHILGSDIALLIDDDEVFEDPEFLRKAKEFIGRDGVYGIGGYYLQEDGDYHIKKEYRPWMEYWDQYARMNEAFERIIGVSEPRLKKTPFVFGGNMVIHRNLFTLVPFDMHVPRGEDIDYLINARIFGFPFYLDNRLAIKHLPPPKPHPVWRQLREDIYRFIYERAKIEHQRDLEGLARVSPEDLDPYPGCFLKRDLEEKIEKACKLLSEEYLAAGDTEGSKEALKNIELARTDAVPKFDPFQRFCELQKHWHEMMVRTGREKVRSKMQRVIEDVGVA
ncbi:MAG TPA: hypothetical protein ENI32_01230 [Candidatus Syntrophoarchaeum butanivorans]|uniref:Glycosyltransferase n=1 Tax=Candidatus Syntropharchaeum butanivorans TaxID=1839936 RepID=A0A1F2P4N1_9EURY|nr:MAG: hypothetical protein SBU_001002 [Candidatus Syntrophoarchaeum butanivorans]HEC56498.1 hypothetical protein [Candidatus Syntrophoarchaeum butanivorans]